MERFRCRVHNAAVEDVEAKERERASERHYEYWSTDRETFSSVTVVPGGHFGHSVLHGYRTGSCPMFHHVPLGDFSGPHSFRESTLVMFASGECV